MIVLPLSALIFPADVHRHFSPIHYFVEKDIPAVIFADLGDNLDKDAEKTDAKQEQGKNYSALEILLHMIYTVLSELPSQRTQ